MIGTVAGTGRTKASQLSSRTSGGGLSGASPCRTTAATSGARCTAVPTASAYSCVASTTRAPESARMAPSSAPPSIVETGTATIPARKAAEDPGQHRDVVGHDEHHPVVPPQTEPPQRPGDVTAEPGQLGVRQCPAAADGDTGAVASSHVPVDEVRRRVELGRHGCLTPG